ncbi:unnamed protein product [Adineta ricciae]|uniref:EGF-like domain-containing protein n=1 Tax=Adineta ricciae TaxID=249248 RepID=A0A814J472_ADIRI|nr:unnamed protein product [Adineta ricciae]CAF1033109.1 unnamed protein product [Adineta ricciae]
MPLTLAVCLLFVLFHTGLAKCPIGYNDISGGCYKVINGTGYSWKRARDYCTNDSQVLPANSTVPGSVTHLLALEYLTEQNALFYWMSAYSIQSPFWIDGMVAEGTWNWSGQAITWYFAADKRAVIGNGTNYKLIYNANLTNYQIADDVASKEYYFICEYQVPCNSSGSCGHNSQCYTNLGDKLCICSPGYTGPQCDTEIDECLAAPCLHGGVCKDQVNNYTCDCTSIYYTGGDCETEVPGSTENQRKIAFWTVLGVVIAIIVILTLSDLPWVDIVTSIGCGNYCQTNKDAHVEMYDDNLDFSGSPTNDGNYSRKVVPVNDGKPSDYHVRTAVWTPEYETDQISAGHRSTNRNMQEREIDSRRVYAVDINQSTKAASKHKDPADTMVSWTQQLQEQLRNKQPRQTSAGSTKQLVHSPSNDNN